MGRAAKQQTQAMSPGHRRHRNALLRVVLCLLISATIFVASHMSLSSPPLTEIKDGDTEWDDLGEGVGRGGNGHMLPFSFGRFPPLYVPQSFRPHQPHWTESSFGSGPCSTGGGPGASCLSGWIEWPFPLSSGINILGNWEEEQEDEL